MPAQAKRCCCVSAIGGLCWTISFEKARRRQRALRHGFRGYSRWSTSGLDPFPSPLPLPLGDNNDDDDDDDDDDDKNKSKEGCGSQGIIDIPRLRLVTACALRIPSAGFSGLTASDRGRQRGRAEMDAIDFYDILGIQQNASEDDIRKAYRKLAIRYHPDKNKDAGSEETFKKIAEAYEVLSDPQKRQTYDRFGLEGVRGNYQAGEAHDFAERGGDFFGPDPFETFRQFFGASSPFGTRFADPFQDDPFFSQGMGSFGRHDVFGGSMFGGGMFGGGMFSSGMMSSAAGGGGGYSESTSIQEVVINGRRVRRVEKIIRKPDGTVERNVTEETNEGSRQVECDNDGPARPAAIPYQSMRR